MMNSREVKDHGTEEAMGGPCGETKGREVDTKHRKLIKYN